jgi:hypothetical protein
LPDRTIPPRISAILLSGACLLAITASQEARAIDPDLFVINGYSSFEVEKQWGDEGNGDPYLSFDADLFDIVLNFVPTERVRAAADVTWEHGAASEDGRGNVALEYAFVEYTVSDAMRLRVGKHFVPFGLFNEVHTAKPAFLPVKEAAATNKPERIVDAERFFPRWAAGISVQGDLFPGATHIDYKILVSNGEQENTNPYEEDDNLAKAVTGRVRLEAGPVRVGTSSYYDYLSDGGVTVFSQGGQLEVYAGAFELWTEVVAGTRTLDSGGGTTQLGWFIQPAIRLPARITPYIQIGFIDPDLDTAEDEGTSVIGGINIEPSRGLQLKIEHNWLHGATQSSLADLPGQGYHETKAAVVLGF